MAAVLVRDLTLADQVVRKVDGVGLTSSSDSINLGAVRYNTIQHLTEAQKATVRSNIGATSGGGGTFFGEFANWSSVPTEVEYWEGETPDKGDFITIEDFSDFFSDDYSSTYDVQYITSGDPSTKKIVSHLYVGRKLSASLIVGSSTISKGTVLTEEHVSSIGDANVSSISLYDYNHGKWFLQYIGDDGTYSKDYWVKKYQINNDIEFGTMFAKMTEVDAKNIMAISSEAKRAIAAEDDVRKSIKVLTGMEFDFQKGDIGALCSNLAVIIGRLGGTVKNLP